MREIDPNNSHEDFGVYESADVAAGDVNLRSESTVPRLR